MYFITDVAWEVTNPLLKVFDEPERPRMRWKAVELPLAVYYFLVHIPTATEDGTMQTDLLFADLFEVLGVLKFYEGSTLHIQVPGWDNDGELALFRVNNIYKTLESKIYLAECCNSKIYIISLAIEREELDIYEVEKEVVWSHPNYSAGD